MDSATKLQTVRGQFKGAFVARDAEIDGLLIAVLARTNLLLLGPPGTAKSYLTETFARVIGGRYFNRLFTAFTTPEEIFGPWDLSALDAGRYERLVDGYLPTAEVGFADEIFKASSAILNSMLTLLNERQFDNGTNRVGCPLQVMIGASNEYPEGDKMDALYDRFLVRRWVDYVPTRQDKMAMLTVADPKTQITESLTIDEIDELRKLVASVDVPVAVLETLIDVCETLARDHGLVVSDRRLRALLPLVKAHAFLNGRTTADKKDLMVLADSVWHRHEQRASVVSTVLEFTAPAILEGRKMVDAAREIYDGIGDFRSCPDLAARLQQVEHIESDLNEKHPGNDADYDALIAEVVAMRKGIARGFAQVAGILKGLR